MTTPPSGARRPPSHRTRQWSGRAGSRPRRPRARPPTSGCWTGAVPPTVHTDPAVLRIQSEFVEGFGLLAELAPGGERLRQRPHAPRPPALRGRRPDRCRLAQAGFAVITGGGPGAMEAANRARGRRPVGRPGHRAALRAGPQRVGRRRHRLPLLLRAQDDVREVRRGVRDPARRFRHARRAVRGADPGADAAR